MKGRGHERFGGHIQGHKLSLPFLAIYQRATRSPTNEPSQIPAAVSNLHTTALVEKEGKSQRACQLRSHVMATATN